MRLAVLFGLLGLLAGCATPQPQRATDLCELLAHEPRWYDYARESQEEWGTPIPIQMAFVRQESAFRHDARPPRVWLLGIIPWGRQSTAYGYAQAQDPVWGEYMEERGSLFARRTSMRHSLDFIGWYNQRTHDRLGIAKTNARHLYLAYHEGHTGYRRRNWESNTTLLNAAARVERTAEQYERQLAGCEAEFRCRRFWQIGPFCDA